MIKIDRIFVANLNSDTNSGGEIVEVFIGLAKSLNLEVIAEGIENDRQQEALLEMGCRKGQDYFIDKPMGLRDFAARYQDREQLQ